MLLVFFKLSFIPRIGINKYNTRRNHTYQHKPLINLNNLYFGNNNEIFTVFGNIFFNSKEECNYFYGKNSSVVCTVSKDEITEKDLIHVKDLFTMNCNGVYIDKSYKLKINPNYYGCAIHKYNEIYELEQTKTPFYDKSSNSTLTIIIVVAVVFLLLVIILVVYLSCIYTKYLHRKYADLDENLINNDASNNKEEKNITYQIPSSIIYNQQQQPQINYYIPQQQTYYIPPNINSNQNSNNVVMEEYNLPSYNPLLNQHNP